MFYADILYRDFHIFQGEWPWHKLDALLTGVEETRWIIVRPDLDHRFHLFRERELSAFTHDVSPDLAVSETIPQDLWPHTPLVEAFDIVDDDLSRVIVLEDDRLIGFYDEDYEVPPTLRSERHPRGVDLAHYQVTSDFPEQVPVDATEALRLYLDTAAYKALPHLEPGTPLDVSVFPKTGFAIEGQQKGQFLIPTGDERPALFFQVHAKEAGAGHLQVLILHEGNPLNTIDIRCRIYPRKIETRHKPRSHYLFSDGGLQPDLQLIILEHENRPPSFMLLPQAPGGWLSRIKPPTVQLNHANPYQYFDSFFSQIEALVIDENPESWLAAEERLARKGVDLYRQIFPEEIQRLIWRERARIRSIFIQSNTPLIPWEVCKLYDPDTGEEGPFFAEAFALSRWLFGIHPIADLSLRQIASVFPEKGPGFTKERQALFSLKDRGVIVTTIDPTYRAVLDHLRADAHDAWHFSGHGEHETTNPDWSRFHLENPMYLSPEDLNFQFRSKAPHIFINACQTGRSGPTLTDMGGWVVRFLKAGAGSFLGTYWRVKSNSAAKFTKKYYNYLLDGIPLCEALRLTRIDIKNATGDPSWLAYMQFADPRAHISSAMTKDGV